LMTRLRWYITLTALLFVLAFGVLAHCEPITNFVPGTCVSREPLHWLDLNLETSVFVSWHANQAGCEPTTESSRSWYHVWTDDRAVSHIDWSPADAPACGRFQLDVRDRSGEWFDDVVVDTGVDCVPSRVHLPPSADESAQMPEPVSLVLFGTGLIGITRYVRGRSL